MTNESHTRTPETDAQRSEAQRADAQQSEPGSAHRSDGEPRRKATRLAEHKRESTGRRNEEAPAFEQWSRDELLERAGDMSIKGRDSMSRDELIDALRNLA